MLSTSIIVALFVATVGGHTPTNGSEVFVTYAGHSEAGTPSQKNAEEIPGHVDDAKAKAKADLNTGGADADDQVLFIPNEKQVLRNEDLHYDDDTKDLFAKNEAQLTEKAHLGTETPNNDVLFISGKNFGSNENPEEKKEEKRKKDRMVGDEVKSTASAKLNCSHLDCDVVQVPVCGGKLEQKQWKYRLFLNECFFRKVNCGFRNRVNRYKLVQIEKCKDTAAIYSERPFVFKPAALIVTPRPSLEQNTNDTRRSFASRRAMNMGSNGQFCSHPCPASCTEDYDPQCASSATGQKRVFLNHCKLDQNSCLYRVVWHRRPLSWCVGGKMADMRQNRGFIAWMQRNGLVDRKGRLSLN